MTDKKQTKERQLRRIKMKEYENAEGKKKLRKADIMAIDATTVPLEERLSLFEKEVWELAPRGTNAYIAGRALRESEMEFLEKHGFYETHQIYCPFNYVSLDGKKYSKWTRKK